MRLTKDQRGAAAVQSFNEWRDRYRPQTREEEWRFRNGLVHSSFLRHLRGEDYPHLESARDPQPLCEVLPLLHRVYPPAPDLRLRGRAVVFGRDSRDRGGFRKRILPGAVRLIATVRALLAHDDNAVFASTDDGSLQFTEDRTGLSFVVTPRRYDAMSHLAVWLVQRRAWSGCSFGGWIQQDEWILAQSPQEIDTQVIRAVAVEEISVVTHGAFPAATVAISREPAAERVARQRPTPTTFKWNPHVSDEANRAARQYWADRRMLQPT